MTDDERMMAGKLYDPYKVENNPWNTIRAACKKFNDSEFWNDRAAFEELKSCFAEVGDDMWLGQALLLQKIFRAIPLRQEIRAESCE